MCVISILSLLFFVFFIFFYFFCGISNPLIEQRAGRVNCSYVVSRALMLPLCSICADVTGRRTKLFLLQQSLDIE